MPKAWWNKQVFRFPFKKLIVDEGFMNSGKAFQSVGATTEKAHSPLHFKQDRGTVKSKFWEDAHDVETGKKKACPLYQKPDCAMLTPNINTLYWIL